MSDDEFQPDDYNPDDGGDDGETLPFTPPISAVPPRVVAQEENQMEVSSSPAFQCLDEVFKPFIKKFCLLVKMYDLTPFGFST